jgi:hypothetical protein
VTIDNSGQLLSDRRIRTVTERLVGEGSAAGIGLIAVTAGEGIGHFGHKRAATHGRDGRWPADLRWDGLTAVVRRPLRGVRLAAAASRAEATRAPNPHQHRGPPSRCPALRVWRVGGRRRGWAGQWLVTMGGTGSRGVYRSWVSWPALAQALKAFR